MQIFPIPALKDNYIWALVNANRHDCIIVDPGSTAPVFKFLAEKQLNLAGILITHHHWDHTDGIAELIANTKVPVFASARDNVQLADHLVSAGDFITLPALDMELKILDIPGHTLRHVAYYGNGIVFTGDTLFTGGCGRVFEGTPAQMLHSLQQLATLPADTLIYCGHEYTQANLQFAALVEPNNAALHARIAATANLRAQNLPTVPATLELELQTNPFLRCDIPSVIAAAEAHANQSLNDNTAVFTVLRTWKNQL